MVRGAGSGVVSHREVLPGLVREGYVSPLMRNKFDDFSPPGELGRYRQVIVGRVGKDPEPLLG